jgi:hypothetical protein
MRASCFSTAIVALVLVGCPKDDVPPLAPPTLDATDGAILTGSPACANACAVMGAYCREGRDPSCAHSMTAVEADRLIAPAVCPPVNGQPTTGCTVTCAWCATASSNAEVVAKCGSSCSP